jgi:1,2-diacylglycerol 3-alpha-glucosyltransferase
MRPESRIDRPRSKFYCEVAGRGTQVVRERSAKPLCVSSILTRASNIKNNGISACSIRRYALTESDWNPCQEQERLLTRVPVAVLVFLFLCKAAIADHQPKIYPELGKIIAGGPSQHTMNGPAGKGIVRLLLPASRKSTMRKRLVLLTEIIAPYRIPVFNALARQEGLDFSVIFLAETDKTLRQWRVYKDEIRFPYRVLPSWRWRAGKNNFLLNRGLWSALAELSPQVIICGGYNYLASWGALLWARRHGTEFVLWSESNAHDARSARPWTESLKSYFLEKCNRFVVPGKASLEYMRALGAPAASILIAPNAIDNGWFLQQSENVRTRAREFREKLRLPSRFILFVGRLVPEKGVFDLIEAYAKLDSSVRSEVGLVFAGDGVSREELMQRAKQISPGSVCFQGFAQREELAAIYALADALVLPTHSDTWGLVVNEAMACGLPIIVTDVAGCAADLVEDGWNGYVVPSRAPDKLCAAIDSVVRHPEVRQAMSTYSVERIQNYSPEACAAGLAASAIPSLPECQWAP